MSYATISPKQRTCYVCWRVVGKDGICRCGSRATFRGEHPRVQPWEDPEETFPKAKASK